jgi:glycosyltransferase involved in cell wall biosynthesis
VAIIASPFWEPLISNKNVDLICYDYLDALVLSPDASYRAARKKQEKLIAKSELIFVTAEALREDTLSVANEKDVILVSNGVDAQFFEENKSSYTEPGFHKKNNKTVGYIGSIYGWLDIDLVYEAAKQLPLIDFVFVGPSYEPDKLNRDAQPSNVYLLGPKEYHQVPSYINMLDIGLIPFKPGPISEASDPVKLYEYFSLGKPVVATDLRPLRRFNDARLLKIARTPDELVEAINFFLTHDSDAWQASRKRVALQNSWLSKASAILSSIETHIS